VARGCFKWRNYVFLVLNLRDVAVGIATGWTTEGSEFESQWGQEFSLLHVVQTGSGAAKPPFYWVPGRVLPRVGKAGGA
jgi:hypothetical protein